MSLEDCHRALGCPFPSKDIKNFFNTTHDGREKLPSWTFDEARRVRRLVMATKLVEARLYGTVDGVRAKKEMIKAESVKKVSFSAEKFSHDNGYVDPNGKDVKIIATESSEKAVVGGNGNAAIMNAAPRTPKLAPGGKTALLVDETTSGNTQTKICNDSVQGSVHKILEVCAAKKSNIGEKREKEGVQSARYKREAYKQTVRRFLENMKRYTLVTFRRGHPGGQGKSLRQ